MIEDDETVSSMVLLGLEDNPESIVVCIVLRVVRELEEEPEETVVTEVPELLVFEDNFEYCSCNAAMC